MGIMPSGSTPLQHALAELTAEELAAADCREIIRAHDAAACDEKWLPWLAWENSIGDAEGWMFAETEGAQRNLIKGAYELHRKKGTPWAIREIVRRLGFGQVELIERMGNKTHNGEIRRDGRYSHGHSDRWAHYRIIMSSVITNDQAALLRKTLAAFAPARCLLAALDYQAVPLRYNGRAAYDGNFNFGAA